MKLKDLIRQLKEFNQDLEVFVPDEYGYEKRDIDIKKVKNFLLDSKLQSVIKIVGSDSDTNTYIF